MVDSPFKDSQQRITQLDFTAHPNSNSGPSCCNLRPFILAVFSEELLVCNSAPSVETYLSNNLGDEGTLGISPASDAVWKPSRAVSY